jgi:hypothetical protein
VAAATAAALATAPAPEPAAVVIGIHEVFQVRGGSAARCFAQALGDCLSVRYPFLNRCSLLDGHRPTSAAPRAFLSYDGTLIVGVTRRSYTSVYNFYYLTLLRRTLPAACCY